MEIERIKQFAIKQGYDDVIPLGKWKGFDIYEPIFTGAEVSYIGLPLMVLVKGEEIRMSTPEEAMEQLES